MNIFWFIVILVISAVCFHFLLRKMSVNREFLEWIYSLSKSTLLNVIFGGLCYCAFFKWNLTEHPIGGIFLMIAMGFYVAALNIYGLNRKGER